MPECWGLAIFQDLDCCLIVFNKNSFKALWGKKGNHVFSHPFHSNEFPICECFSELVGLHIVVHLVRTVDPEVGLALPDVSRCRTPIPSPMVLTEIDAILGDHQRSPCVAKAVNRQRDRLAGCWVK